MIVRAAKDDTIGIWDASSGRALIPLVTGGANVDSMAVSADGGRIDYVAGPSRAAIRDAERTEYDEGILVDQTVDLAQNLYRGGWVDGRLASQRYVGFWVLRGGLTWRLPRQLRRFDPRDGSDRALGAPQPPPAFRPPTGPPPARSARGDLAEILWNGASGSIAVRLAGTRRPVRCAQAACTSKRADWIAWRPGTRELVMAFADAHRRHSLYRWHVPSGRLRAIVHGDGLLGIGQRGERPCAITRAAAYCVAAGPASPPRLVRIDLEHGAVTEIMDPNADWRTDYVPAVERLHWKSPSGTLVTGTLLRHIGVRVPAPLFVNYYGCDGFLRGGEGDEWPIPALIDAGFAIACLNAAPSSGAQDAVENYKTGSAAVHGIVGQLTARGIADPSKIAMGGFSFGSEVAMWIAIHSDLLAALSVASAQSDPAGFWYHGIGGRDRQDVITKVWGLQRPEEHPRRWAEVSAALNAERIEAPTLLQLPEQEARRIPQLAARLTQSRTPAELHAFPDEGHIKVQPRHRFAAYARNLDWFRYWLQDMRDPDPAKAAQYRRWDALRDRARNPKPSSLP